MQQPQPGDDRFPPHLAATTWRQRLNAARAPQEVVGIARDFLAAFTPYELHALPDRCRPPAKLFAEDVSHFAFDLVRQDCTEAAEADVVPRLASFFAHASARLAQLAAYDHASSGAASHSAAL